MTLTHCCRWAALATMTCTSPVLAQTTTPNRLITGYFNVDAGLASPSPSTLQLTARAVDGVDSAEFTGDYRFKRDRALNVGGGAFIGRRFGVGLAVSRYSNEQPAGATLVFNHPMFHPPLTAQFTTSPLERRETALHVQFSYRPVDTGRFTLTLFGGPSRIRVQQRLIEDLDATETFNPSAQTWSASIDDVDVKNESAAAWGAHVGADGSYFFSRYVGVGGLVRYSRATVSLADPIRSLIEDDEVTTDVKAGGVQLLGGLRVRF